jgi:hypothetical protein
MFCAHFIARRSSSMDRGANAGRNGQRFALLRTFWVPVVWLRGTTLYEARLFRIRHVDLSAAVRVQMTPNRIGGTYLEAEDCEGQKAGCHTLILGRSKVQHLSAEALERLSEALRRSPAGLAATVCAQLEGQAAYLRAGGFVGWSPLRRHTEWHLAGTGEWGQEQPLPGWRDPFGTCGTR